MLYVLLGKIRNVWKADKLQSFSPQLNSQRSYFVSESDFNLVFFNSNFEIYHLGWNLERFCTG